MLERLLAAGTLSSAAQVKAAVSPARPEVPALETPEIDLRDYDALLGAEEVAS